MFATSRDRGGFFYDWGVSSGPISTNTHHIFPPKASPPERNTLAKKKMKILQDEGVTSGPTNVLPRHIFLAKASAPWEGWF